MRIHDIELAHVRGIEHLALRDIPDTGVIVISGENEAGKSTILEAIHTLKNIRHGSSSKAVKALQPKGRDVGVKISLRLTLGPHRFRITKQYLRKTAAVLELETPRRESFTGGEAEEKLAELFSEYADQSLLDTLFVSQGQVDATIKAAGIPSLSAALERVGDESTAVVDDTEFMQTVDKEYLRFYTKTAKETGELAQATNSLREAEQAHATALATKQQLDGDVDFVERETARLVDFQQRLPDAEAELQQRQELHQAATAIHAQLHEAQAAVEHHKLKLKAAKQEQTQRAELRAALTEHEQKLAELSERRSELAASVSEQSDKLAELSAAVASFELLAQQNKADIATARQQQELLNAAATLAEQQALVADLDRRDKAITKLRAELPEHAVSKESLAEVSEAAIAAQVAQAALDASAASLRLSATETTDIFVGGEEIQLGSDAVEIALTAATDMCIGAVTATFTPALGAADLIAHAQHTKQRLDTLLGDLGCDSVDGARVKYEEQQAAKQALRSAQGERTAVLAGRDEFQLRSELAELSGQLADAAVPEQSAEELAEHIRVLDKTSEQLDSDLKAAVAEQKRLQHALRNTELTVVEARIEDVAHSMERQKGLVAAAESAQSERELGLAVDAAAEELKAAQEAFETVQAKAADCQLAQAEGLLAGAQAKVATLKQKIDDARLKVAEKKGQIERAEGAAEALIKAEEAMAAAHYRHESVLRQARSIKLLRHTLHCHRDAARERYAAPFAAKLHELAHNVFGPGVSFALNEQLEIEQRVIADTPIGLGELSGGAKEQLGILVRFAVAEMIAAEDGVPIFIDDALGSTDTSRLEMMNFLFSHMGKSHQVFVLTCMPTRYENVAGMREYPMDELKSGD
ncbi:AAA family ATPase [Corynebacterium sp. H127]|uniref:AAA family ATPase n=1 Tax=Corynebacterium sp. H127 TaxID=3133418 RepID=UPI0030ACBF8B